MRRAGLLLGLALLLSACRLELEVNTTVEEDGSGVVEVVVGLDEDAVDRIGGDLEELMAVDDLREAGWQIDGPSVDSDGTTRVRISHRFSSPDGAGEVFGQIAAEDGPFQDFAVTRETSLAETSWTFSGRVDFSGGIESFGDAALAEELDGEPLGQTVEEIEEQLGDSLSRLIDVRVSARLPGEVTSNATTRADNGAVWDVGFGEDAIDLRAEGTERRTSTLVLGGIAAAALLGLVVLLVFRLARRVTSSSAPSA